MMTHLTQINQYRAGITDVNIVFVTMTLVAPLLLESLQQAKGKQNIFIVLQLVVKTEQIYREKTLWDQGTRIYNSS